MKLQMIGMLMLAAAVVLILFGGMETLVAPLMDRLGGRLEKTEGAKARLQPGCRKLGRLQGMRGVAETHLYPSGKVKLEDRSYDALAEKEGIPSGTAVEVCGHKCFSVIVRPAAEDG